MTEISEARALAERVQGRLDRVSLSAEAAGRAAGLADDFLARLVDGRMAALRGKRLARLADVLATSVSYLVGLDPDAEVPPEFMAEDQGSLGLLAGDEEALLRAYRRLDVSLRAALLQVVCKMTPEVEAEERAPRKGRTQG